jgi:hypothetical protein
METFQQLNPSFCSSLQILEVPHSNVDPSESSLHRLFEDFDAIL